MKTKVLFFRIIIFFAVCFIGFFGFGLIPAALAGQCKVSVTSFDYSPKPIRFNQPMTLNGTVSFAGSVLNGPGTQDAGYCTDNSGQAIKRFSVDFSVPFLNRVSTFPITSPANGTYNFSVSFTPSDKGGTAGQNVTAQAVIYADVGGVELARSNQLQFTLSQGVYPAYGCQMDDGTYACSPKNYPDCSDASACKGRRCVQLSDTNACKTIYACVATNGNYACSSSGGSTDSGCVNTSGCSTASKQQCKQIPLALCGSAAGTQPGNQPSTQPGTQPGTGSTPSSGSKVDCTANPDSNYCLYNPLPVNALGDMLLLIMQAFLLIIGLWSVAFVVIGGFRYVMSRGNEEAVIAARKTITWAILGLVIALLSFSIVAMVKNIFQANTKPVGLEETFKI